MPKFTFALFIGLISVFSLQAQWTLAPRPTNQDFFDIEFTSADTGYAGTIHGEIYQTIDSGASWQFLYQADSIGLFSIHFLDSQNGYIAGGLHKGRIFKTTDAGQSWTLKILPNTMFLTDVFFPTDSVGYASSFYIDPWSGSAGAIYKTTDAGQNWINLNLATSLQLRKLHFLDDQRGYALTDSNAILKTMDGGVNWLTISSGLTSKAMDFHFTSVDTGYVAGILGQISKTTDGGLTWSVVYNNSWSGFYSVHFINTTTGYAAGTKGLIAQTLDAGATWTTDTFGNFNNPSDYGWFGISSYNENVFLAGHGGKIAFAGCIVEIGHDSIVSCGPITWRDGFSYSQNEYSATIVLEDAGQNGCDSLVSLKYTNIGITDNTVTAQRDSLFANLAGATYQWIDCEAGNAALPGATQRTYRPLRQGSFAVVISKNGCSDTSRCFATEVNLSLDSETLPELSLYPNPANDLFYLEMGSERPDLLIIYNQLGQEVYRSIDIHAGPYTFALPKGLYSVKLSNNYSTKVLKLLID